MKTNYTDIEFKNNGKLKLLIIVGTRPEIIRLGAVITKCRKYFDCILAHTGQNYDYNLNGVFFRDLKLEYHQLFLQAYEPDQAGCAADPGGYEFLSLRHCGKASSYSDLSYGSRKSVQG